MYTISAFKKMKEFLKQFPTVRGNIKSTTILKVNMVADSYRTVNRPAAKAKSTKKIEADIR